MFKHILLPTDGSALSQVAVEKGIQFACTINARITGFYAITLPHSFDADIPMNLRDQAFTNLKELAEKTLSKLKKSASAAGVECEVVLETNFQPYVGIINFAEQEGCDLIMMASHGRSGLGALLIGSETQKVLTHSKIPVLVYR
jgi:nucleotide-binding universal stress UspA family protein